MISLILWSRALTRPSTTICIKIQKIHIYNNIYIYKFNSTHLQLRYTGRTLPKNVGLSPSHRRNAASSRVSARPTGASRGGRQSSKSAPQLLLGLWAQFQAPPLREHLAARGCERWSSPNDAADAGLEKRGGVRAGRWTERNNKM